MAPNPGKLRYGYSGTGSTPRLMAAELWRDIGLTRSDIPCRDETTYRLGLIAGDIEAGIVTSSLAHQQMPRPLLVFSKERFKRFRMFPRRQSWVTTIPRQATAASLYARARPRRLLRNQKSPAAKL